ncbi:MAG: GTP-binding protein, partial [Methanococcaceae archaeon]
FVGHIKLFLDNGSETVKQSVTIYYERPQEDIIKSEAGSTPVLKVLSAVSNVKKEDLKAAVDSSVQEIFEEKGIPINKTGQVHTEHKHARVQKIGNISGKNKNL